MILLLASTGWAKLERFNSLGGTSPDLELYGDHVYLAQGANLHTVNVADPENPVEVGRIRFETRITSLSLDYPLLAVGTTENHVRFVDLSDPTQPAMMAPSEFVGDPSLAGANALALAGDLLFVSFTVETAGFFAIHDISDPLHPVQLAMVPIPVNEFEIDGTRLFVATPTDGIKIYDISNPAAPAQIGSVLAGNEVFSVSADLDRAVAIGRSGSNFTFWVLFVADPSLAAVLGSFEFDDPVRRVAMRGSLACVAFDFEGIAVVDIVDPLDPRLVGRVRGPFEEGSSVDIELTDGRAFLSLEDSGGLLICNIDGPTTPTRVGRFAMSPGDVFGMDHQDDILYFADSLAGVRLMDISDGANPVFLSTATPQVIFGNGGGFDRDMVYTVPPPDGPPGPPRPVFIPTFAVDVDVVGPNAFTLALGDGLFNYSVADLLAPNPLDFITFDGAPERLFASPTTVFVPDGPDGTFVIDVRDPSEPTPVTRYTEPPTRGARMAVDGTVLYVLNPEGSANRLFIYNVFSPDLPGLISSVLLPCDPSDIVFDEGTIALAGCDLTLVDVANPLQPKLISQTEFFLDREPERVAFHDSLAVLSNGKGLYAFDVSDKTNPKFIGSAKAVDQVTDIAPVAPYVHLADFRAGMTTFRVDCPPPALRDLGDIYIGNTGPISPGEFVYPDALDLRSITSGGSKAGELAYSFIGGGGRILINGIGPLDPSLSGPDDPLNPARRSRLDQQDIDPGHADFRPQTLTFRNAELSPIGGGGAPPAEEGLLEDQTASITLFVSDGTTYTSQSFQVFTWNGLPDWDPGEPHDQVIDFTTAGDAGGSWSGGVVQGQGFVEASASGLCMSVPALGDNIVGWVSPERFIELIDGVVYRARVEASTDQQAVDAIPLWFIDYDNFNSSGGGNTFGGSTWFLDVDGGGQGIGRAQGRTHFESYIAPNAMTTAQWRGSVDPVDSAFDASADGNNDVRLIFKVVDVGSSALNSNADSGTICIRNLRVEGLRSVLLETDQMVYDRGLNTATHFFAAAGQENDDTIVTRNNQRGEFYYQLGPNARRTMGPYRFDNPSDLVSLYPVAWQPNTLYRGKIEIRSFVDRDGLGSGLGFTDGADPVDAIGVIFDTPNSELGQFHWTTRGSAGNMRFAASPRLEGQNCGRQEYVGYFYGQGGTRSLTPNMNRLRLMGDFINAPHLFGEGTGRDPFAVSRMTVETVEQVF